MRIRDVPHRHRHEQRDGIMQQPAAASERDDRAPEDRASKVYGRRPELNRIDHLLRRVRGGRFDALLLSGEAGIGKSTLLNYAAEQAADMLVLRVSGVDAESQLPFAGLHGLLHPVFDEIDRIPESQATALRGALGLSPTAHDNQLSISGSTVSLLSMLAEHRPVVCLVDDVQWLDAASINALGFAQRRLGEDRVAMLFALRTTDGGAVPCPSALSTLEALPLKALDQGAVDAILNDRPELRADEQLQRAIATVAAGNPLALVELTGDDSSTGAGGTPGISLGLRLERVCLRRAEALAPSVRRLLLVTAAEDSGELGVILEAARQLGASLHELAQLERLALVQVVKDRVRFVHPLIGSAVYQAAAFHERQEAHVALASALADHDQSRSTWHRAAAAVYPAEGVREALETLARSARRRAALTTAAAALERAATLTADWSRRGRLLVEAAELRWELGSAPDAEHLAEKAAVADHELEARVAHLRGRILVARGAVLDGYELLTSAATRATEHDPSRAAWMIADAARAASYGGDIGRQVAAGRLTDAIDAASILPAVMLTNGVATLLSSGIDAAAPLLRSTMDAVAEDDDPARCLWAGTAAAYLGDLQQARSFGVIAASGFRATGALTSLAQALELLSVAELADAPLKAETAALEGLQVATDSKQVPSIAVHLSTLATVSALRGNEEHTVDCAAQVFEMSARHGLAYPEARAMAALGLLDLALGRPQRALDRLDQLDRSARHIGVSLAFAADLVEAAVRAGQPERARAALTRLEEWSCSSRSPWAHALLERSRALLGVGAVAEDGFVRALELEMTHGPAVSRARTQLLFGEFLRRERRQTEARQHLRAAAETFRVFDAGPWARRAEAELRATGESVRRRHVAELSHLTPQERQIARLVATGMSSKEAAAQLFLSPRTVDYHLRKIFAKTGIASRTQLRDLDLAG